MDHSKKLVVFENETMFNFRIVLASAATRAASARSLGAPTEAQNKASKRSNKSSKCRKSRSTN